MYTRQMSVSYVRNKLLSDRKRKRRANAEEPPPLSGFGQPAVYVPLVGQVVQDAVVGQGSQFGVDCALPLLPAALITVLLRLLALILLALLITALVALHLRAEKQKT